MLLDIYRTVGVDLPSLAQNQLSNWVAPYDVDQRVLPLTPSSTPVSREWDVIAEKLTEYLGQEEVLSLLEIARQLGVDVRLLYHRVPTIACALGQRFKRHLSERARQHEEVALQKLHEIKQEFIDAGRDLHHLRDLTPEWRAQHLPSIPNHYRLIQQVNR